MTRVNGNIMTKSCDRKKIVFRGTVSLLGLVILLAATIYYFLSTRHDNGLVLIGTVDANQVIVSSRIPGRIERLLVLPGARSLPMVAAPVIQGYLVNAGLGPSDFAGAGGTATPTGHGKIYDDLYPADFLPTTCSGSCANGSACSGGQCAPNLVAYGYSAGVQARTSSGFASRRLRREPRIGVRREQVGDDQDPELGVHQRALGDLMRQVVTDVREECATRLQSRRNAQRVLYGRMCRMRLVA